jgi:sec-independent protein translocase protein TatB
MLDLGLTKMALIGVVALVVLGPERLPRVARTAGALFGRAQRYINDVKAEVTREIELDELRRMKTEFEQAATNVEKNVHDNLRKQEGDLNDAWSSGTSVSPSIAGGASGDLVTAESAAATPARQRPDARTGA